MANRIRAKKKSRARRGNQAMRSRAKGGVSDGAPWFGLESCEPRLLLSTTIPTLEVIYGPTGDLSVPIITSAPEAPEPPTYLLPEETVAALVSSAPSAAPGSGVDYSQEVPGDPTPPVPGAPAQGLNFTASNYNQSFFIPPDTHGAVGPNHIVELINGSYAVFNKDTGAELDRSSLNQFWTDSGVTPSGSFDPRVVYDSSINRFYAAAVNNARADNQFLFAISVSSNPLDGWLGFAVDTDSDNGQRWADFPQLSFDAESIHIGVNMFDIPGGTSYATTRSTLVLSKADLTDAFPDISDRTLIEDHQNITGFSAQGVSYNPDPTGGLPSVFFSQYNSNTIRMSQLVGTPTTASFQVYTDISLAASSPPDADQLDTSKQNLDTGSARFTSEIAYRNGTYWLVEALDVGGDASFRFLEISTTGTVLQNQSFGTAGDVDLYFPSLAVNNAEDVVIGFSWSSSAHHPSAGYFTGTTTAGTTTFNNNPFSAQAFGAAGYQRLDSIGRNRWGDYSHTVVDPSDDNTFWTFQEFAQSENIWATRVTEIRPKSPDLTGAFFNVIQEPLDAGETFDIDYQITNQGDGASGSYTVDFYLSANSTISTGDQFLGSTTLSSLAPGATTSTLSRSLTLPSDSDLSVYAGGDGIYYIGMIVDADNDAVESNENNNRNVAEFTDFDGVSVDVYPDLPNTLTTAENYAYFHFNGVSYELTPGASSIDFAGDVDSWYFAGDSGWSGTYTIELGDFGNAVDPVVAVYDATTGAQLGANDNAGPDDDSRLTLTLNSLQRYIVAIADVGSDTTGDVELTITAPSSTTPSTISLNANGDGSRNDIIGDNDTDFFQFTAPANADGTLTVRTTPAAGVDIEAFLLDAAGNQLAQGSVAGPGAAEIINFNSVTPGQTYYLSVLTQNYDGGGAVTNYTVDVNFGTSDVTPPRVTNVVRDGGTTTRFDRIQTLAVTFSEPVNVSVGDLTLFNNTNGVPVGLAGIGFGYNALTRTATWNFAGVGGLGAADYTATVHDSVTDLAGNALDGDNNATPGGDFDYDFTLYLAGDADRDGDVDTVDLTTAIANFTGAGGVGKVWATGDFDGDGDVDTVDLTTAIANFTGASAALGIGDADDDSGPAVNASVQRVLDSLLGIGAA